MMDPTFHSKLTCTLLELEAKGLRPVVYRSFFTPEQQAELWVRSRAEEEIRDVATRMERQGAPNLASLLLRKMDEKVISGRRETDLLPGQSWHQYGEASDIKFLDAHGRSIWVGGYYGYEALGKAARSNGLVSGYFWNKKTPYHVQLRDKSVREFMSWSDIDRHIGEKT